MKKQTDFSILCILKLKRFIKSFIRNYNKHSNNDALRKQINYLQFQVDSMQNLIRYCIDITNLPKAKGDLRKLQLADTIALEIFDFICKKHGLTYWVDYGTLIGTVRHKGFIPWDDDIDLGMPREDYEKIRNNLYKEFEKYGFIISEGENFYYPVIRLIYKNSAVQIDLWPYDSYYKKVTTQVEKQHLSDKIMYCNKYFYSLVSQLSISKGCAKFPYDKLKKLQDEIILNNKPAKNLTYFSGCDAITYGIPQIINGDDLFPLKQYKFEDITVPVPNNFDYYLKNIYGDYMSFPIGKFNHGNIAENINGIEKFLAELEIIRKDLK